MYHNVVVYERHNERTAMQITTIGFDLAKHWFQVHGVDANGRIVVRRRQRRSEIIAYSRSLELSGRHGGLRDSAPLGARADRTRASGEADAAGLREGLRQAQQERCRRCRSDL